MTEEQMLQRAAWESALPWAGRTLAYGMSVSMAFTHMTDAQFEEARVFGMKNIPQVIEKYLVANPGRTLADLEKFVLFILETSLKCAKEGVKL